ncbi:PREDICTED: LOW QUALITY PROTEIN: transport and Golgi organization protein 1 [Dufourea novaeangliae]|uniref:LOW QUALITY PROTEIN: transport and Golgi organization protein 1 n=1 Tax=Dufourea novaeangliae TaxID=178035 RepID=UPI000766F8B9|nr:PREDICTED: LOW QUALITY PROTEIN: transport and Golgi organization protein 1 [Dufourea novaeangliae]
MLVVMWNCNSGNMTKRNRIINIVFLLIAIIFTAIPQSWTALSNKRLCYDPDCSELISLARTKINYSPNEEGLLGFKINTEVKVYSKEAGSRTDLWGVEIDGKHGYVSQSFLKEYKIFRKNLQHEVPIKPLPSSNKPAGKLQPKKINDKSESVTEVVKISNVQSNVLNLKSAEELPYDVTPSYEIIDGTTLNVDHNESSIQPSFATKVVQTAVVPNKKDVIVNLETDSNSGKDKGTIFTEEKLSKEVLNNKVDDNEQNISQKDDINDFVASSEEVLDLPKLNGIKIPPINANINFKNDLGKVKHTIQTAENEVVAEIQDVQSSEKHNTKEKIENNILDSNGKDAAVTVLNKSNNIDLVKTASIKSSETDKQVVQTVTEFNTGDGHSLSHPTGLETEQAGSKVDNKAFENISTLSLKNTTDLETEKAEAKVDNKASENSSTLTLKNITELETEQAEAKGDNEDSENSLTLSLKNTTELEAEQVEAKGDNKASENSLTLSLKNTTELETEQAEAKVDNKTSENISTLSLKNTTELKTEQAGSKVDNKSSENSSILSSISEQVLPLLVESDVNQTKELPSNTIKEITDEETPNVSSKSLSENVEIKITSDIKTVAVDSQSTELEENNNATSDIKDEDTNKSDLTITSDLVTDSEHSDTSNTTSTEDVTKALPENIETDVKHEMQYDTNKEVNKMTSETASIGNVLQSHINTQVKDLNNNSDYAEVHHVLNDSNLPETEESNLNPSGLLYPTEDSIIPENVASVNEFQYKLNLIVCLCQVENLAENESHHFMKEALPEHENDKNVLDKHLYENSDIVDSTSIEEEMSENIPHEVQVSSPEVCAADNSECSTADDARNYFMKNDEVPENTENGLILGINIGSNYWMTLMYLIVTAAATLIFSLGYYYIENMRRDGQLIAKINKLEKDLLVSTKESSMLIENLKVTQDKLTCIEDESFGSNEMVLSLKADLVASQKAKAELEDQVAMLEKDLESATEAGLELERMLREVLSSDNEVNPIAQSVEDLQTRLNAQQTANESLTNALNLKTQENESLSAELASFRKKYEELEVELVRVSENLKLEVDSKNNIQQTLTDKVQELEIKMKEISMEKIALQKELKNKEVEVVDLIDVINQLNSNNLDLEKLYDVSRIKAEATILLEERNELKIRLTEVEGAHSLLEEHMKVIKEEVCTLSEQCKAAEKEKKDAETRLEVLSNFFKEKEAQRQKEEAIWLQQQGEVVSTVERIQTMQNEVQNYKQQIEMLKQEILDQEREYKNQISHLETKAHEQWVIARQVERRLEESKVEAGQLRNRLTLIEKNINDVDPEVKLHRLEANGETATLPPLFIGAESSSSPIMFSGSSGVPLPPPPSYLHALFPPYLPPPLPNASSVPPYEISQRPPPLGGRLSSPPPMPLHPPASSRYDNTGSPPPMSPHLHPSFNHRIPPPPFGSDHIHSPPPPPPGSVLPAHLGSTHSWGEESLPPPRSSGFHPPQRERVRNHKGSLHSSGESLDKSHHSSKV